MGLDCGCELINYALMQRTDLKSLIHAKGLRLSHVADVLGVDKATVTRWAQDRVPAERARAVADITGIELHELRPDLWPREGDAA